MNVHFVIPVFYLGLWNGILCTIVFAAEIPNFDPNDVPKIQWAWLSLVCLFAVTGADADSSFFFYESIMTELIIVSR